MNQQVRKNCIQTKYDCVFYTRKIDHEKATGQSTKLIYIRFLYTCFSTRGTYLYLKNLFVCKNCIQTKYDCAFYTPEIDHEKVTEAIEGSVISSGETYL